MLVILTDGAVEAGLRVAWWKWDLTVSPSEGCVRAVTAVSETAKQQDDCDLELT